MTYKFVIRCFLLFILIKFIFSENITFSTNVTLNILDKLESLNEHETYFNSSLSNQFEIDKQSNKICSDKVDLDNNVEKILLFENNTKFKSKLSWSGDIVFGSLQAIFCFLSFLGNSFALVIFFFREKKLSSVEVFFINIAIVDILLSIASYPMSTVAAFRHQWDFGQIGCTVYGFICYFLGLASISSITSIALIRYLKTCDPVRGNQITCQTSGKIMAVGCLIALLWAAMPLIGFGSYEVEPYGLSCTLNWMANNLASRIYIILVTIFVVLLPLLVITFCYIQIIRIVRRSNKKLKVIGIEKRNKRSDVQLTWISILITIGFIVAWSPYTIVSLYSSFSGQQIHPVWITVLPSLLAKSSIILNPIIYVFFTERYRHDFIIQVERWFSRTKMLTKQAYY